MDTILTVAMLGLLPLMGVAIVLGFADIRRGVEEYARAENTGGQQQPTALPTGRMSGSLSPVILSAAA